MRWWSLFGKKRSVRDRQREARRRRACRTMQLEAIEPRHLLSTVSILATKADASEQPQANGLPDFGQVAIVRDTADGQNLVVTFQLGGTATCDYYSPSYNDYTLSSNVSLSSFYDYNTYSYVTQGTVAIPAGQTSVTVSLVPVNDDQRESGKTATLTLLDGSGGGCCCCCGGGDYTVSSPSSATITIADNDQWAVTVEATDSGAAERGPNETADLGRFEVSRSGETDVSHPLAVSFQLGGPATYDYYSPSWGDYSLSSNVSVNTYYDYSTYAYVTQGIVVIPAGQSGVTVDLTAILDDETEPSETAVVTLRDGTGTGCCCGCGAAAYTVGSPSSASITIADAPPEISVRTLDENGYEQEIDDGSGSVSFGSTSLGTSIEQTFTIYNTGYGVLVLEPASLSWPAGFSLMTPFAGTVAAGGSTTFTLRLDATSGGQFHGTVSFASNDPDESPFGFWLYGDVDSPQPEISVRSLDSSGNEQEVYDNSGSVSFNTTSVGTPVDKTFTIYNTGDGILTLDPASVAFPSGVTLLMPFAATVAAGSNTSFTLRLGATMAGNYAGSVSFATNDADESLFNFTISGEVVGGPGNRAPTVANPISDVTVDEDAGVTTIALAGVFADEDLALGDQLILSVAANDQPTIITASLSGTSLTLSYAANQHGVVHIRVSATDSQGAVAEDEFAVTVSAVNDAPQAVADTYSVSRNGTLSIAAAQGVLANDTDVDGDSLTTLLAVAPSHGTLTLAADGSFTYTPASGFLGSDGFAYRANDAMTISDVVQVTLNVVNHPPVAMADELSVPGNACSTLSTADLLNNDEDSDEDPLVVSIVSGVAHGTLTQNGNGTYTYVPVHNFVGSDSFTYSVSDGLASSNVATVVLHVTTPAPGTNFYPTAVSDSYSLAQNTTLTVPAAGVLSNDSDADNDPLAAVLQAGPSHGTLTYLNADGAFRYVPSAGFAGTDAFSYVARDGLDNSNVATVTLNVTAAPPPPNQAPLAANDSYSVTQGATLIVAAAGVLANDTDADNDPLTAVLQATPSHGTLSYLNANGAFGYVPNANFTGIDTFSYLAHDGIHASNVATVTIQVSAAGGGNTPPMIVTPIPDRQMETNSPARTLDLSDVFVDSDPADGLTFSIGQNTNSSLVAATLSGSDLVLAVTSSQTGTATIRVRATDIAGAFAEDLFQVSVVAHNETGNPPIVVTSSGDGTWPDDYITLREAVELANTTPGPDLIQFNLPWNDRTIHLSESQPLTITSDLRIAGPADGSVLTVTLATFMTPRIRLFAVHAGSAVAISDLMILGGDLPVGDGGAVWNAGELTLSRVTVADSTAVAGHGGGIYNTSGGTLLLTDSTISGNAAAEDGGGIYNAGIASLVNVTIADNSAVGAGSGIDSAGATHLRNSLVATNTGSADASGHFASAGHNLVGNGSSATGFDLAGANGDQVGGVGEIPVLDPHLGPLQDNGGAAWTHQLLAGSPAIDAGDNGAISETDQRGAARLLDGLDPHDGADTVATVDIGAFEFGTLFVNTAGDVLDSTPLGDGRVDSDPESHGDQVSLRGAVRELNALGGWNAASGAPSGVLQSAILFSVPLEDLGITIQGAGEDAAATGDLDIYGNLTIRGRGPLATRIDGFTRTISGTGLWDRIIHVHPGSRLQLESLYIGGGFAPGTGPDGIGRGGGILNDGGTLVMSDVTMGRPSYGEYLHTADLGGAIYTHDGQVTIVGSRIEGGAALQGGGLFIESGSVRLDGATYLGANVARNQGGGIYLATGELVVAGASEIAGNSTGVSRPDQHQLPAINHPEGGGLYVAGGIATITEQSRVRGNTAWHPDFRGAGIFNAAALRIEGGSRVEGNGVTSTRTTGLSLGGGIYNTASLWIQDSRVTDNGASFGGGGIYNAPSGVTQVSGGEISGNLTSVGNGADKGIGGGIYNQEGQVVLSGVQFARNRHSNDGGAIYNAGLDARLTITGCTFDTNWAVTTGGALMNYSGTVTITDSTFVQNYTPAGNWGWGGAIYNRGQDPRLTSLAQRDLILAAAVNHEQTTVFVNDASILSGLPLPLDLLIDGELVSVTAVDFFRDALSVVRGQSPTTARPHAVSALADLVDYLRVDEAGVLSRYRLPLDILVDNEVMTVTALDAQTGLLSVERGRNGTARARHAPGQSVYGIAGPLTISGSTFFNNRAGNSPWHAGAYAGVLHNELHPYVRPTVIENSTFLSNSIDDGVAIWTGPLMHQHWYDVYNGFTTEAWEALDEELTGLWTEISNPTGATLFLQNTVLADSLARDGTHTQEVMGFADDPVNRGYLDAPEGLSPTQSWLCLSDVEGGFPELPFRIRVSWWDEQLQLHDEEMQVTAVDGDRLTVMRGQEGQWPIAHPNRALVSWARMGLVPSLDLLPIEVDPVAHASVDAPEGISPTQNSLRVSDVKGFFPLTPFAVRVSHRDGQGQVQSEEMEVTAVVTDEQGMSLRVLRGRDGTTPVAHPDTSLVTWGRSTVVHSGGHNLVGVDSVTKAYLVPSGVDESETTLHLEPDIEGWSDKTDAGLYPETETEGFFPEVPFTIRVSHLDEELGLHDEEMLVTDVFAEEGGFGLAVLRGQDGTSPIPHPGGTVVTWSRIGLWMPGDKHGASDLFPVVRQTELLEPQGLTSTGTEFRVTDASGFPQVPFEIRVSHVANGTTTAEDMLVVAVNGNTFSVARGAGGTVPVAHPNHSQVTYSGNVAGWHESGLGLLDRDGSALAFTPLPGSPLLERGSHAGLKGLQAAATTGLSATFGFQTPLLMAVVPGAIPTHVAAHVFAEDQTLTVDNAAAYPPAPFLIRIEDELLKVLAVDTANNLLTVQRGAFGTAVAEHESALTVLYGSPVGPEATRLNVAQASDFPAAPFLVQVGTERMRVTAVDADARTLTVQRGQFGTTAQAHPVLAPLGHGTLLQVDDVSGLPDGQFVVRMGDERMLVTGVDRVHGILTVQRGLQRTSPSSHLPGATLLHGNDGLSEGFQGRGTLLAAPVTDAAQTEITVRAVLGELRMPFVIRVGQEEMQVTEVTTKDNGTMAWRVVRGVNGTSAAQAHVVGDNVLLLVDARGANRFADGSGDAVPRLDIGAVEARLFTVNSTADRPDLLPGDGLVDTGVPGEVTLRAAVMEADGAPGLATVLLPSGTYHLAQSLEVNGHLALVGDGAASTTLIGGPERVFLVHPEGRLRLLSLTVTGGNSSGLGGGVYVDHGHLSVEWSVITGNTAASGGGIANRGGSVSVAQSTISGNTALAEGGGILNLGGDAAIRNSTLSGNTAAGDGGGVLNDTAGQVVLISSTIAANAAGRGGGLYNLGRAKIGNALVATNTASSGPADLSGRFVSQGHNLIGVRPAAWSTLAAAMSFYETKAVISDNILLPPVPFPILVGSEELLVTQLVGRTLTVLRTQNGTVAGSHAAGNLIRLDGLWRPGDQAGTASAPLAPLLGPLQANHGPVPTHALLPNSPALDAGEDALFDGLQLPVAAPHRLPADIPLSTVWATLPSPPFDLRLDGQTLPIVAAGEQRLTPAPRASYGRSSGWSTGATYYDLDATATLLADQRGAARLFKDYSGGYNGSGGGSGGSGSTSPGHTIDVGAYELVPELSLSVPATVVMEGSSTLPTPFTFRVSRAGRTTGQTTVDYVLSAVGAHPVGPADFASATLPRGTLTFAPGQTVKDVQIEIAADTIVESNETFQILLTNATPGAWILEKSVQGTILDDDTAALHVTQPSVVEGSGLLFEISLEHGVQGGFRLPWQTADGTAQQADQDYQAAAGMLIFAGAPAETHRILIVTMPDETVERNETMQLLTGALAGLPPDLAARVALPDPAVGTITNDDVTTLRVDSVRRLEGDSGNALWEFQVTLGPQPVDTAVSVTAIASGLTATASEDFQGVTATLNFDGSAGQTRVFSVPVFGDLANEPPETFAVSLAAAEAGGREPFITLGSATGTIANDDDPRLVVRDVTQAEGDSSSGDFVLEVVLLNPLGGPLAVTVTSADGSATAGQDYLAQSQTLNFAGLAGETHVFAVAVHGDQLVERDETFQVVLSNLQAGGQESSYTLVNGAGTIRNDDQARLSFVAAPPCLEGSDPRAAACRTETSGVFVFRAVLEGDVDVPFTVTAATYDETAIGGEDYDQAQVVLAFSGQDEEAVPFSVYVRDDGLSELDETLGVRFVNLQAQGRSVELGPNVVALILSDERPDPIPGEDEEEEEEDPPCIPAEGGEETNPPETGSSPRPSWFPEDWIPPAPGVTSWGATFSAERFAAMGLFVDAAGHLILPDGTIATSFFILSNGSGQFAVVTPPGVQMFNPYGAGGTRGPGGDTDSGETCPPEEEEEEDPTFYPLETVSADWVVPYTESLTFNPFPTFNYRLAQDVALTVGDGNEAFVPVGGSVTLTYGTVTVNPDFTLTYTPAADLPTRTGDNRLKPELDAHGRVFRYTGIEHFEAHLVDAGAVAPAPSGGGEGEEPPSPIAYASVPVELAVSNHLPALRGSRIHDPRLPGTPFHLDSPVFVDLDTTVRVDLKQLFVDRDGDGDLSKLRIKEVTYNGQTLDMSKPATSTAPAVVDRYPHQIRVPIASTTSGMLVTDPNTGVTIVQFGGDETEPAIIAMPAGASAIDFYNTIWPGLIATLSDVYFPSQIDFQVTLTDGSQRPVFDFYGQPMLDANGQAIYEDVTWDLLIQVRPNPDQDHWRAETSAPAVDFRPWVEEVTPKIDPLVPDDTPRPSTAWSLTSSQPSSYGYDLENVGGVDVDLYAGEFRRYHELVLDGSGGTSELAIPGLVYDSSVVQVDATAMPVVTAVVRNQSGSAPSSIQATLTWYNHNGPVTSPPWVATNLAETEHLIAISPPAIDDFTGVYGWTLTVTIGTADGPIVLKTAGETPVIAGNHLAIFGAGWGLQGVPFMWLDTRDQSDASAIRNTYDDRLILGFPGEAPKVFDAMMLTLNNFSYAGELASLQPGSTEVSNDGFRDPQEFGTLTSRQDPDELIYDDGTGREYVFRKHQVNGQTTYLIHRIEQPGIEFDRTANAWPAGRRGVSFQWDDATYAWPVLSLIEASDGARTLLSYATNNGYLSSMTLVDGSGNPVMAGSDPARVACFDMQQEVVNDLQTSNLVQIWQDNGSHDPLHVFAYQDNLMTLDQWYDDSPVSSKLVRHTEFQYDRGLLSKIQLGDGIKINPGDPDETQNKLTYVVKSATANAMENRGIGLSEFVATVTVDVPDLKAYAEGVSDDPATLENEQTPSVAGSYRTDYEFSLSGLRERREEFFKLATPSGCTEGDPCDPIPVSLAVESWDYDHVGFVKRYTDPLGRQTFYWHDYEEPTAYALADPSTANDQQPRYDPNDYRGNVTYVFSPAGQTVYQYETDDETGNALGQLVKRVDKPKISATGKPKPGGPNAEVVTLYDYRADGQMTRRQTIRGNQDRVTDLPQGTVTTAAADAAALPPAALGKEDRIELWTYTSDNRLGSFKDVRGLLTEYTGYDSWGRLTSSKTTDDYDGQATVTVNSYDAFGYPDTVTVADGAAWPVYFSLTDYDYDRAGLLQQVQIKNADGIVLRGDRYEHAPDGVLTATIDGNGVRNVSTYDKAGLLTEAVRAAGARAANAFTDVPLQVIEQRTQLEYYQDGTLSQETLPDGTHRRYLADPVRTGGAPNSVGATWVLTDGVAGESHVDTSGAVVVDTGQEEVVRTQYDAGGRVTSRFNLLTGSQETFSYQQAWTDLPTEHKYRYVQYLGAGETVTVTDTARRTFRYDSDGNLLASQVITPELPSGQAAIVNRYDDLGYLKATAVKASYGGIVTYETNAAGNVVCEIEYRRRSATSKPVPFVTTRTFDEQGRLRLVVDPVSETGTAPAIIDYAFDEVKGLSKVTTSSRTGDTTVQWFNAAGWLVEEVNPFGGTMSNQYDQAGNRTHERFTPDPLDTSLQPRHTEFVYDALNRVRVTHQHGPATLTTYTDYMLPDETTADWDLAVTNPAGGVTLSLYDSLAQPILVMQPAPGPDQDPPTTVIAYGYEPDWVFRRVTTRLSTGQNADPVSLPTFAADYQDQRGQQQFFDAAGRLLRSNVLTGTPDTASSTFSPREQFTYDGSGRVMKSATAQTNSDGTLGWNYTLYHHDDAGSGTGQVEWAVTPVEDNPATPDDDESRGTKRVYYQYDSAGNCIVESDAASFAGQRTIQRVFDGLGRLTWEGTPLAVAALASPTSPGASAARVWKYRGKYQIYTDRNGETIVDFTDPTIRQRNEYWFDAGAIIPDEITASFLIAATRVFSTVLTSDGRILQASQQESGANSVYTVTTFQYDAYGNVAQETQEAAFADVSAPGGTTLARTLPTVRLNTTYHSHGPRQAVDVRIDATNSPDPADDVHVLHNEFAADPLGRITSQLVDFRSPTDLVEKQKVLDLIANESIAPDRFLTYAYNADHVLREFERFDSVLADPAQNRAKTIHTYYPDGTLYNVVHQRSSSLPIARYLTTYDDTGTLKQRSLDLYDSSGSLIVELPAEFTFDAANRLSGGRQYDASGNRTDGGTIVPPNLQVLDAAFASLYDHEGQLAVKTSTAAGSLPRTTYEWDPRGRLVRETTELDASAGGGTRTIEYGYDALDRLVSRTEIVSGGTLPAATTWAGIAYDGQHRLFEFDSDKNITRHWLTSEADGQVLAVDDSTTATPTGDTEVVWMYADASGVVRSLAHVLGGQWYVLHRNFSEEGEPGTAPNATLGDTDDTLLANAPQIWNGLLFDEAGGHYLLSRGGAYDPLSGRSISDRGGTNGYVLFGNNPVQTRVAGSESGLASGPSFGQLYGHYLNPLQGDTGDWYTDPFVYGKLAGWTMFVVGAAWGGAAAASGAGTTAAGIGIYFGKTAITAGASTALEGAVAGYTGDESFNPFSAFARNFTIDAAIGWMPGAAESKLGVKAGALAARMGGRFGRYAFHYGSEVAIGTAADTAWSVGIEGRGLSDAFTQSLVGNMIGQGVGDVLSAGLRRGMQRLGIQQFGRICFVAGTLVERGHAPEQAPQFTPIERIELGQRVNTDAPREAISSAGSEFGEPDAATWRKIVLRAVNAADADVELELLRPVTWLEAQRAAVGAVIHVDLPELNTRGPARVLSIEPSPEIQAGPGTVVTGRFRHVANSLMNVHVEGLNEPIGCTEQHLFWSVTRGQFVPANRLQVGELLLTNTGQTAQVVSITLRSGSELVYNLELLGPHVYRVSDLGLLVHNASFQRVGPTFELAQAALSHRKTLSNPLTGRNVMVFEYVDDAGELVREALVSQGKHTERMMPEGTRVLRIFSEREPCQNCFNYIEDNFPTAEVTYMFPYRNKLTRVPTYTIQSTIGKTLGIVRS